jgi:hypothetical protein
MARPGPIAIAHGAAQTLLVADAVSPMVSSALNRSSPALLRIRRGPHYDLLDAPGNMSALPAPLRSLAAVGDDGFILGVDGGDTILSIAGETGWRHAPLVVTQWGTIRGQTVATPSPSVPPVSTSTEGPTPLSNLTGNASSSTMEHLVPSRPRLVSIAVAPPLPSGARAVYVLDAADSCVWAVLMAPDQTSSSSVLRVAGNVVNASTAACAADPSMAAASCVAPDGDDDASPGSDAVFLNPTSIALNGDGTRLFVAERGRIRVIENLPPAGLFSLANGTGSGVDEPVVRAFAGSRVPAPRSSSSSSSFAQSSSIPLGLAPMSPTHLAFDAHSGALCFTSAGWVWCAHEGLGIVVRVPFSPRAANASAARANVTAAATESPSPWPRVVGGLAFSPNGMLHVSDTLGRRVLAVPATTLALTLNPPQHRHSGSSAVVGDDDGVPQHPVRFVRVTAPAGSLSMSFAELELFSDDGADLAALGTATMSGEGESGANETTQGAYLVSLPGCVGVDNGAQLASSAIDGDAACSFVVASSPSSVAAGPWWEVDLRTTFSPAVPQRNIAALRLTPLPLGQSAGLGGATISFLNEDREVVANLSLPDSVSASDEGAFTVDVRCLLSVAGASSAPCPVHSSRDATAGRHFTVYANAAVALRSTLNGLAVADGHDRQSLAGGEGRGRLNTGADLADGAWRHVVVVYASNSSAAADQPAALSVYVDGAAVLANLTDNHTPRVRTDAPSDLLVVGDTLPGVLPAPLPAGTGLDDLRIYAGALADHQVRFLFERGQPPLGLEGGRGGEDEGAGLDKETRPIPLSPDFEEDRPFPMRAGPAFSSFNSPCPGGVPTCAVPVLTPAQRPAPSLRVPSDLLLRRQAWPSTLVSEIATTSVADEALPFDVDVRENWLGLDGLAVAGLCAGPNAFLDNDGGDEGGLPLCGPLASVEVWGETVASLLPEDVAGSSLRSDFDRTAFVGFAEGAAVNAQATLQSEAWAVGNVSMRLAGGEGGAANESAALSSSAAAAVGLRLSAVVWGLFIDVSGARLAWPYDCAMGDTWECPSSAFLSQDAVGNVLGVPVRMLVDLFGTAGGSVSGTPLSASVLARIADGTLLEDAREAVRASPLLSKAWAEVERAAAGGRRLKGEAARALSLGLSASSSVSGLASLAVDAATALDSAVSYLAAALAESDVPSTLRRMRVTGVRAEAKVEVGTRRFGESFAEFLFPGGALESATVVLGSQTLPTGEKEEPLARHLACSLRPDGEHPVPAVVEATLALLDVDGDGRSSSLTTTFAVHLGRLVEWLDEVSASLLRDTLALPSPSLSSSRYWSGGWSAPVSTVLRMALDYGVPRRVPCGPLYGPTFGPPRFAAVYGCEATREAVSPPLSGYWLRPRFMVVGAGGVGSNAAPDSVVTQDKGAVSRFWAREMRDPKAGPLASELSGYGPGQVEHEFVLWDKVVPFDSNDAAACGGEFCSALPPYCAAGGEEGEGEGGGSGGNPEAELDLRVLARSFPGNRFDDDVVVASRETCALLLSRGTSNGGLRCTGEEVVVDRVVFEIVGPAEGLGIAAGSGECGGG